ncbi:unnamed protein product [Citrullus colocynthis]|uniref:caffeoyl-CoA O-methyltransferase n=1 Tax=Citrullus colocynthis TaxID=252529 RepID=A0ABP0YES0_9ROSI
MTTSADEGQFLNMLLKLINAKNTMEIGVYTGYSLLATALYRATERYWQWILIEKTMGLGLPVIQKAGHKKNVEKEIMEKKHRTYDFIFVDADNDNYINYHKRLIDLVKVEGVIDYDNTLWNGSVVAPPDAHVRKYVRYYEDFVLELKKALALDPRINWRWNHPLSSNQMKGFAISHFRFQTDKVRYIL